MNSHCYNSRMRDGCIFKGTVTFLEGMKCWPLLLATGETCSWVTLTFLKSHLRLTHHRLHPRSEVGPTSLYSQQPVSLAWPTFLLPVLRYPLAEEMGGRRRWRGRSPSARTHCIARLPGRHPHWFS